MNPTIKDVAKKANVSIATVSRVLNNLQGYSDQTKAKVYRAIEEIGYQPNAIARGLINKKTQTIGVMFPTVSSLFSSEILHGVEDFAQDNGYSVMVCNTDSDGKRTLKYLQVLREKQVDGLIFSSEVLKEEYYQTLQQMRIPYVLVSTESGYDHVPYIKVNDFQAAYDAVEYLIRFGHRKIALLSGTKHDTIAGIPRIEGYKKALENHGIPINESYIAYGDFLFDVSYKAMEELLSRAPDITAIFAASDEMAIAAISVAAKYGIKVPDELSIIGYDDLKLAQMSVPPLTTVRQPLYDMGNLASQKLIHMIKTGKAESSCIVAHSIVERQTVRAISSHDKRDIHNPKT
ncbi:LacI family DNA-binding transcriptional regulator [Paenibacillus barengoltzii]|jgi:LacI family transcriptional regulator|uniref:LacI family DNA-binding transcriptional regulator n=1 Tax=Paenibacillus barengoltzii TaxID=343517 RepID=UPI000A08DA83|nr:substrate-binding domain-containing protein [Paenibacillus barengoltzii]MEC2343790.1 substrate-binding domain-containing protein [Paenibacillus barengoltzii]SMF06084.1 transcriptional regulator, LacI family [Paenibacillus barengoltzii]